VPDPYANEAGSRLYRTGDRARLLADGTLLFVGRNDDQIKIRGFRVELGDVEGVLHSYPGVRQAHVMAVDGKTGDKRLIAYVVSEVDGELTVSDLRSFLKAKLPDYLVPTGFQFLKAIPLTANGKIDRAALQAVEPVVGDDQVIFRAPATPFEVALSDIWSQVLGVERVGTDDNFFELGGHSLLATRVLSRIRDTFGVELALRQLFEAPTVGRLAVAVLQSMNGN
jgi:acyl carrier protein